VYNAILSTQSNQYDAAFEVLKDHAVTPHHWSMGSSYLCLLTSCNAKI
jgi:hypothetical protein